MLKEELRQFNSALADKKEIIAVNKVDVTEVRERKQEIERSLRQAIDKVGEESGIHESVPLLHISAVTGEGLQELLDNVVGMLAELPTDDVETDPPTNVRSLPPRRASAETVYKENGIFIVESEALERLVSLANTRDQRVMLQLWREMTKRGLSRRLTDEGIEPGDTIRIGQVEVEWF
jgi:GTP-binding protein